MKLRMLNTILRALERVAPGQPLVLMRQDIAGRMPTHRRMLQGYREQRDAFDKGLDEAIGLMERFLRESEREGFHHEDAMRYDELLLRKDKELRAQKADLLRAIENL